MTAVLVGTLTAAAVLLALRPRVARPRSGPAPPREPVADDWVRRGRRAWPPLALLAGWAFGGGWGGLLLGAVAAVVVHHVAEGAEPAAVRREREAVRRDLPVLVLLLATALRSGSATGVAARQVLRRTPRSGRRPARRGRRPAGPRRRPRAGLGALAADPELAPLGRALARAERTGAPIAGVVERLADDLATTGRPRSRTGPARSACALPLPLGLCLLPAFLLLGIVPLVASLVAGIRL